MRGHTLRLIKVAQHVHPSVDGLPPFVRRLALEPFLRVTIDAVYDVDRPRPLEHQAHHSCLPGDVGAQGRELVCDEDVRDLRGSPHPVILEVCSLRPGELPVEHWPSIGQERHVGVGFGGVVPAVEAAAQKVISEVLAGSRTRRRRRPGGACSWGVSSASVPAPGGLLTLNHQHVGDWRKKMHNRQSYTQTNSGIYSPADSCAGAKSSSPACRTPAPR